MNRSLDRTILRYLGYASLFSGVLLLLYLVRGTLPIFMVALLLAYAMEPVLQIIERRGHSRASAVCFVFLVFVLLFACLLGLLGSAYQQVQTLYTNFPQYRDQLETIVTNMQTRFDALPFPTDFKASVTEAVSEARQHAPARLSSGLQGLAAWMIGSLGYVGLLVVVLPIITFWIMLEMNRLRGRALMLIPPAYRPDVTQIAQEINQILGRYVRGQLIVCSMFGVLCTISFHILNFKWGMGYPLLLGMAAGLLYIVPFIGMATLAVAAGATAYFTASQPVPCALVAIGSCVVFNLILDYGVSPRVIGKGVGLHPLLVIFALLSGAQLGGIPGMILAIPFFASLRVVLLHLFPQLSAPIAQASVESKMPASNASPEHVAAAVVQDTGAAQLQQEDSEHPHDTKAIAPRLRRKVK